jgi:hypothetical protein
MYFTAVESDQLYTWSDESTEAAHRRTAETPQRSPAPIATAASDPARFSYRALQTMRQARLQMRRWCWPWPKYYLSVSYPGLRPQMDYVPQESYAQTAEFLSNYHQAREILETICEINRELLRRREAL